MKSWTDTKVAKPDCEFPDWMWTWLNLQVGQVESICHSFHAPQMKLLCKVVFRLTIPLNTPLLLTIQVCPFMFASSRGAVNWILPASSCNIFGLITAHSPEYLTNWQWWLQNNALLWPAPCQGKVREEAWQPWTAPPCTKMIMLDAARRTGWTDQWPQWH